MLLNGVIWAAIGFSPTILIVYSGVSALRHQTPEAYSEHRDRDTLLSWVVTALAVLAAHVLAVRADVRGVQLALYCILPLVTFTISQQMMNFAHYRQKQCDEELDLKSKVKWVVCEFVPVMGMSIYLLLAGLFMGEKYTLVPHVTLYMWLMIAGYAGQYITQRLVSTPQMQMDRLAPCDLYHKVIEIGKQHGVEVEQVHIIRNWFGWTGALAHSDTSIAISRNLVDKLDKDEVDAVTAHEIGHLADRSIWWSYWIIWLGFVLGWLAVMLYAERLIISLPDGFNVLHYIQWFVLFLLPPMIHKWYQRYHERKANIAVPISVEPRTAISSFYKLHKLNYYPLNRPWWAKLTATHHTLAEELASIAKQGGISQDELRQICAAADADMESAVGKHYEVVFHERVPEEDSAVTRPSKNKFATGKFSSLIFILIPIVLLVGIMAALPLEKYHPILPMVVSLAGTVALTISIWLIYERRAAAKSRQAAAVVVERLEQKYPLELRSEKLLVDAILMGDWDDQVWQGAYLVFSGGQMLVLGEAGELRVDIGCIRDVTQHIEDGSSDTAAVIVWYEIDEAKQWVGLRPYANLSKNEPRSVSQLEKYLKNLLQSEEASLANHRLSLKQWLLCGKRACAAVCIAAVILGLLYLVLDLLEASEGSGLIYLFAISMIINPLWNWIKQASTQ